MKTAIAIFLLSVSIALATNDVVVYEFPAPTVDVAAISLTVPEVSNGEIPKVRNAISLMFEGCNIKADRNGVNLLTLTGSTGWTAGKEAYWLEVSTNNAPAMNSRCFTNEIEYIGWTNKIFKFVQYLPEYFPSTNLVMKVHKHDHLISEGRTGCVIEQVYP